MHALVIIDYKSFKICLYGQDHSFTDFWTFLITKVGKIAIQWIALSGFRTNQPTPYL